MTHNYFGDVSKFIIAREYSLQFYEKRFFLIFIIAIFYFFFIFIYLTTSRRLYIYMDNVLSLVRYNSYENSKDKRNVLKLLYF